MKKGFTLIELLIVIAIIAILAVVVFVALDPLTRFQKARDAQRYSDVGAFMDALKLDQVDNGGTYLATITGLTAAQYYTIGTCAEGGDAGCTAQTTQAACADLTGLVTANYLPAVPMDPSTGTAELSDYYITKTAGGAITIGSCDPEDADAISVSR
ncbi:MAG: hypothetical protein UT02_C0012G0023 [Parcubacteria group bacterium GW2011_GWC2_38_7]|nr:MAG: hypothetical protein UT02_C0012G0023 [Parcubacteria group bacterium GW2011_GWC2_38_7]